MIFAAQESLTGNLPIRARAPLLLRRCSDAWTFRYSLKVNAVGAEGRKIFFHCDGCRARFGGLARKAAEALGLAGLAHGERR